jgi:hypothetical protein
MLDRPRRWASGRLAAWRPRRFRWLVQSRFRAHRADGRGSGLTFDGTEPGNVQALDRYACTNVGTGGLDGSTLFKAFRWRSSSSTEQLAHNRHPTVPPAPRGGRSGSRTSSYRGREDAGAAAPPVVGQQQCSRWFAARTVESSVIASAYRLLLTAACAPRS